VSKRKVFRSYSCERDAQGMPTKLFWEGDFHVPSKEELDRAKLEEHERIYGKRPPEPTETKQHELQHLDSPTWCVHCGTFDIYCDRYSCTGSRDRKYDTALPGVAVRMARDMFGTAAPPEPGGDV
jgi:hypothetical protein